MLFHDIETDRLLLRGIAPRDREFILRQFSTGEVSRYLYDEEPFTCLEEADGLIEFYNQPEPRAQHRWILVDKETGGSIGTCGFHCWDWNNGCVEIGYDLQPAWWGKGLMTEAVSAILAFAGEEMKAKRVIANIYVGNERSAALAKRLGFECTPETTVLVFRGEPYNHNIYALDLSE